MDQAKVVAVTGWPNPKTKSFSISSALPTFIDGSSGVSVPLPILSHHFSKRSQVTAFTTAPILKHQTSATGLRAQPVPSQSSLITKLLSISRQPCVLTHDKPCGPYSSHTLISCSCINQGQKIPRLTLCPVYSPLKSVTPTQN